MLSFETLQIAMTVAYVSVWAFVGQILMSDS